MLLFSRLSRYAQLRDLTVDLTHEYPLVTGVVGKDGWRPWSQVRLLDHAARRVEVEGPVAARPARDVPVRGEIYDSLLLDLEHRRATRANDLVFDDSGGYLRLVAADVSWRAVLRRLSLGRLFRGLGETYDWKYVEFLRGDPTAVDRGAGYHRRIARLSAGDIAFLCQAIPYLEAAELLTLLPDSLAAEVLQALPPTRQLQVLGELDREEQREMLRLMAPDLAADLLGLVGREEAERLLNEVDGRTRQRCLDLLRYPRDTVGGIMTNDLIELPAGDTVEEARRKLALRASRFINTVYVTDPDEGLHGTLGLLEIMRARPEQRLGELANPYVLSLRSADAACPACFQVLRSGLPALPVLDAECHLLGAVTEDIALTWVAPRSLRDQLPRVLA